MIQGAQAGASLLSSLGLGGGGGDPARNNRKQTLKLIRERGDAVREGAERSGFNPLTYLGATSGTAVGGSVAEVPPLASFAATLGDIAQGMVNNRSVEAEEERLRQSAAMQLDRINREKAVAGGAGGVALRTAAAGIGSPVTVRKAKLDSSAKEFAPYDADREMEKLTATDGPGITTIDNDFLPTPVHVPGDGGEPWGIDEVLTTVVAGIPQVVPHIFAPLSYGVQKMTLDHEAERKKLDKQASTYRGARVGFNQSQVRDYRNRRDILNGY